MKVLSRLVGLVIVAVLVLASRNAIKEMTNGVDPFPFLPSSRPDWVGLTDRELRDLGTQCRGRPGQVIVPLRGKVCVVDLRHQGLADAHDLLPDEIRAGLTDPAGEPRTLILMYGNVKAPPRVWAGATSSVQSFTEVGVVYLPEREVVGMCSVMLKDVTGRLNPGHYDVSVDRATFHQKVADWVSSLPRDKPKPAAPK